MGQADHLGHLRFSDWAHAWTAWLELLGTNFVFLSLVNNQAHSLGEPGAFWLTCQLTAVAAALLHSCASARNP